MELGKMFNFRKKITVDDALDYYIDVTLSIVDQTFDDWKYQFFETLSIININDIEIQKINIHLLRRVVEVASLSYAFLPTKNLLEKRIADRLEARFEIRLRAMVPAESDWLCEAVYKLNELINEKLQEGNPPNVSIIIFICDMIGMPELSKNNHENYSIFLMMASVTVLYLKVDSFWKLFLEEYKIVI